MSDISNGLSAQVSAAQNALVSKVSLTASNISNLKSSAINSVLGNTGNLVTGVANAGLNGAVNTASALLAGNPAGVTSAISGALNSGISSIGGSANGLLQSAGLSSVSSALGLSSFEPATVYSSNNGVSEGDAYAGITARADPLLSFRWYCELPMVGTVFGQSSLPWYYVEETNVPWRSFEDRGVYREGRSKKYATKYNINDLTLGVYVDGAGLSLGYFLNWHNQILQPWDRTDDKLGSGGYLGAQGYKKDVQIVILDVANTPIFQFTMVDCWPKNIEDLRLVSNSSDRLIAQVVLSVDDVIVTQIGGAVPGLLSMVPGLLNSAAQGVMGMLANSSSNPYPTSAVPTWDQHFPVDLTDPVATPL